jgi:purine-nucleoside phosphorylase
MTLPASSTAPRHEANDESSSLQELESAAAYVQAKTSLVPRVGLILGSGLGSFANTLEERVSIPYAEIPFMPQSAVVGHAGNLVLGRVGAVEVVCLQGRVHAYEGHAMHKVVFGARLLSRLGAKAVLITNAAGGIRDGMAPGDLMVLRDHLNLMGRNPLAGPNVDAWGPRFPDLTEAYSAQVRAAAADAAKELGVPLSEGVYAAMLGPSYETPAEIRMLRVIGADAVGMSTVPEVIALRHQRVLVGAMSCITNLAAGISKGELDHAEVEETARSTKSRFESLLAGWIANVGRLVPAQ